MFSCSVPACVLRPARRPEPDPDCAAAGDAAESVMHLVKFVLSLNLHRRHLNESQRAVIATKIANLGEGRPQKTTSKDVVIVSQSDAATLMGVSVTSVQRAKKVLAKAAPTAGARPARGALQLDPALLREPPELLIHLIIWVIRPDSCACPDS